MLKTDIFEEIGNYSDEYAEFACIWIEKGIDDIKIDPSLPIDEVQKTLYNYLSEHYDDFIQEMAPDLFQKIENEANEKWLNGDDDNEDEDKDTKVNNWCTDTNDFLIRNKDEIICIAVTRLYKFLMQS